MAHRARAIANVLIQRSIDADRPITPLQTQKLVYFSHAWMLAINDKPMVVEQFQAWQHGPVIVDLYHALKHHGWQPVLELIQGVGASQLTSDEERIVVQVIDIYGKFSGTYLSALTHGRGTPWDQVWEPGKQGIVIPDKIIKDYYSAQLN